MMKKNLLANLSVIYKLLLIEANLFFFIQIIMNTLAVVIAIAIILIFFTMTPAHHRHSHRHLRRHSRINYPEFELNDSCDFGPSLIVLPTSIPVPVEEKITGRLYPFGYRNMYAERTAYNPEWPESLEFRGSDDAFNPRGWDDGIPANYLLPSTPIKWYGGGDDDYFGPEGPVVSRVETLYNLAEPDHEISVA